jgi:DNA-binding NarL/FixJ family response regulator
MDDPESPTSPPVIRTLIVTDVSLFREGLGHVLAGHVEVRVVGAATPDEDVGGLVAAERPDVLLIDATTVRLSELIPLVSEVAPDTRVVAFAIAVEDEEEVLACAAAGVAGYVARNATVEELVAVLRSAVRGEVRCPPRVTSTIFRQVARLAPFRSASMHPPGFTRREVEIVSLVETGLTNKEIAGRLGIEVATVKNHVHNILEKLHVRRRVDVAALLHRHERHRRPGSPARPGI